MGSVLPLLLLVGCAPRGEPTPWAWTLPEGWPEPWVPADNPLTVEAVALGEALFSDPRLSGNETQSCASCHDATLAFTDGRARALGSTGEEHRRSSMGLANVAWAPTLTWADSTLPRLEDQALRPMFGEHPVELGLAGLEDELLDRLRADEALVEAFVAAWPDAPEPVTVDNVTRALASFQRTLVSADSPYDRWLAGDAGALSESALRGLALYESERLQCAACHGGFLLADNVWTVDDPDPELLFHNTGLYNVDGAGAYPAVDQGLVEVTGVETDMGRFKAPSLRNAWVTAPYMHDGSIATLDDVVDHYAAGGRTVHYGENAGVGAENPYKDPRVAGFTLTTQEKQDLLNFLQNLTDVGFLEPY